MRTNHQKRFSLLAAVLAGLFLLVVLGAQQNFSKKKAVSYQGDNIEVSTGIDAEDDNENGLYPSWALLPGTSIYLAKQTALLSFELVQIKHNKKQLTEGRLYILFHHFRAHIG